MADGKELRRKIKQGTGSYERVWDEVKESLHDYLASNQRPGGSEQDTKTLGEYSKKEASDCRDSGCGDFCHAKVARRAVWLESGGWWKMKLEAWSRTRETDLQIMQSLVDDKFGVKSKPSWQGCQEITCRLLQWSSCQRGEVSPTQVRTESRSPGANFTITVKQEGDSLWVQWKWWYVTGLGIDIFWR